jgi:hypothetical protein
LGGGFVPPPFFLEVDLVKMRALMAFPYNHAQVENGDEFDAVSAVDADMLKLFGRAEAVEEDEVKLPKRKYRRRDMTVE